MGTDIDEEEFGEGDYSRFAERLEECLAVLGQLLARRGFGAGPATVGAELELFLVDGTADRCRVTRLSGPRRPIRGSAWSWIASTWNSTPHRSGWLGGRSPRWGAN